MDLTFDVLRRAWDKIKLGNPTRLKQSVPGLTRPDTIFVKRIQEEPQAITVEFKGIENSVQNPTRDIPLMKRAIQVWLRHFSRTVQIIRSDSTSFVVRLSTLVRLQDEFNPYLVVNINKPVLHEKKIKSPMTNIVAMKRRNR